MSLAQAQSKLNDIERRYDELTAQMNDPEFSSDYQRYMQAAKSRSEIETVAQTYKEYKRTLDDIPVAEEMGMEEELEALKQERDEIEDRLRRLLLPKDPNDERNVIVEIRAAAGGEEAKLFAGELFRMYSRYAERRRWKAQVLDLQETGIGGIQEVTFEIEGQGAYSQLKFEGGVHRVQRVPVTESSGRIQTSTVTVAVLPEAEEVDVAINKNDVLEEVYHSSSAGGQNVQKVATAIRLTHRPTGIVVTCQDERSQLQNKTKAWMVLRTRLYEMELQQATASVTSARRLQVGSGERAEKIRTYNFPDGRVTDHRVNLTIHNVPAVLTGNGKFLSEQHELTFAYSASGAQAAWQEKHSKEHRRPTASLLVLADPDFGDDTRFTDTVPSRPMEATSRRLEAPSRGNLFVRGEFLKRLPRTRQEAEAIHHLFPDARQLLGKDAQEATIKQEARKYRYLHFATHGLFRPSAPMLSCIALAQPPQNSDEDGFLSARELFEMDLSADLVVLSACETGRGEKREGEGILGLTWALFVAGAPTQIVSQWEVNDVSTAILMQAFYQNLKAGQKKGIALRNAMKTLRQKPEYRHPYFWAPFFLVGDWN